MTIDLWRNYALPAILETPHSLPFVFEMPTPRPGSVVAVKAKWPKIKSAKN
jgi:hypothetical protein